MIVRTLVAAASLAAVALVSLPAGAHPTGPSRATVVKDPVTGRLRAPTAEEAAALEAARPPAASARARSAARQPAEIRHPNGAVEMELDESSLSYSVARRNPDGSLSTECVTGSKAAKAWLGDRKPVSKARKESGLELQ